MAANIVFMSALVSRGQSVFLILRTKKTMCMPSVGELFKQGAEYIFKNESKGWTVHIHADRLDEIKKVTHDLKETRLNADYCIN
jgi:hypothetical protein